MNKIHKNSEGHQPLCSRVESNISPQSDDWKKVNCKYCLRKNGELNDKN